MSENALAVVVVAVAVAVVAFTIGQENERCVC